MNVLGYEIRDFFKDIYIPSEIYIINLFHDQGINPLDINPNTPYFKKLFFNFILKTYIETLEYEDKKVFYVIGHPEYSELQEYFEYDAFIYAFYLNMNKAYRLIPMNAVIVNDKYDEFMEHPETYEYLITTIPKIKDKNIKKSYSKCIV